jgi:uncharacterized membrane protein YhhN
MRSVLSVSIVVSAILAVAGHYVGPESRWLVYVFKPLKTTLILGLAASSQIATARYKRAILTGLLFSLGGDVFLMLPEDQFMAGLICFLLAHICYLLAFTSDARFAKRVLPFAVIGIIAAGVLGFLWPALPAALRIPVVVYVILLASMAAQACARWMVVMRHSAAYAAIGGVLFVISDATLAINRFRFPFAAASAWVLFTYYAAQYGIARSIEDRSCV